MREGPGDWNKCSNRRVFFMVTALPLDGEGRYSSASLRRHPSLSMTFTSLRATLLVCAASAVLAPRLQAQREAPGLRLHWYRGNTHTHTKNSDGDGSPLRAAEWYREHGYQFVVITDHEYLTDVTGINSVIGAPGRFLVMRGQEVTQWSADPHRRSAHVNAIGNNAVVYPVGKTRCIGEGCGRMADADVPLADTYKHNIDGILAAGGLAQVNHPNGWWAVKPADLYAIPDSTLLEIWNATPGAHNRGGTDDSGHVAISTEALWDTLLTRGKVVWGVGSDDTHDYFKTEGPDVNPPGKGWIVVQADTLTPEAIMTAMHQGHFYASNGVTLKDVVVSDTMVSITVKPAEDERYHTRFMGSGGRILADIPGTHPSYRIRPTDGYVRAVVIDSNDLMAWTQPTFVRRGK